MRGIVEQIAKGLQAFHRMEMLHQDLRPENIMIDRTGTAKIIDFGSTRIAGIADDSPSGIDDDILGTVQYTAPEYFLGEGGSHALRHIFARRHRLSDADRPAAVWRSGREDQDEIATKKTTIQIRARRQPRNSRMDRRRAQEGGASGPTPAL